MPDSERRPSPSTTAGSSSRPARSRSSRRSASGRFALGMILPSMGSGPRALVRAARVRRDRQLRRLPRGGAGRPPARGAHRLSAAHLHRAPRRRRLDAPHEPRRELRRAPRALLRTGFGSGASNVPMMALVARWFDPARRGRAAGFVAIGSGFGIIASGAAHPAREPARRARTGGERTGSSSGWR